MCISREKFSKYCTVSRRCLANRAATSYEAALHSHRADTFQHHFFFLYLCPSILFVSSGENFCFQDLFLFFCMCVSICVHTTCIWVPEVWFSEAGVTGGCESSGMGAETRTWILWDCSKSFKPLNALFRPHLWEF